MSTEQILAYVQQFADEAHGSQVRKYTGERYIEHPVRVMETVREFYRRQPEVLAAALLHDVLEDTDVTAREMRLALASVMDQAQVIRTVQLVIELTDIFVRKDYPQMNRKSRKEKEAERLSTVSAEAQTIKYADIIDNVTDIVSQDADFARVFVREAKKMLNGMTTGQPLLRDRAIALVDRCLISLPRTIG